jgi:putative ABC transport system permease protein
MKSARRMPPRIIHRFFRWYCDPKLRDHIEGDLLEVYGHRLKKNGKRKADIQFIVDVLLLFRRSIIKPVHNQRNLNTPDMYKSYLKIGWRTLVKEKGYSFINIGGLALGLAVTILIGLWVYNELSYNKHQDNYEDVAAVLQHNIIDGVIETWSSQSYQLGPELRNNYGNYFKHVAMCTFPASSILEHDEKVFTYTGCFMEESGPEILSLQMIHGNRLGLEDHSSVLLSASVANTFFGAANPVGKVLRLDDDVDLKVSGVYDDIPNNSSFKGEFDFIAPLDIIVKRGGRNFGWVNNWLQVFVQMEENADMQQASLAIKDAKIKNVREGDARFKPELFLHALSKWHLYSYFENGILIGGYIEYVWLFGSIGAFVLLLACINFMNLSTARSQKRSKEVGVRKVIGSARGQLVRQFFTESLLVVTLAFVFAVVLSQLAMPLFNDIAGKNIFIDWSNPWLWLVSLVTVFFIAIISGSYPAFYLSAFKPIKVLKGTFKIGRYASMPRRALVVVQFTVSVILTIGAIVVYQQIEFARNRPVGYDLNSLIVIPIKTEEVKKNYTALRNDLLSSGAFEEICTSETMVTDIWPSDWGFEWTGKDPNVQDHIYRGAIDYEFGKTVGWNIKEGRDFSRDFPSDSTAIILTETTVRYMGLKNPIGEIIRGYGKNYEVIGVVEDMITQSLYELSKPTIFVLDPFDQASFITVRISPQSGASDAVDKLNTIFVKYNPNTPFEYRFADDQFAEKFDSEARVGKLVGIFAILAIFISCLGLFGLASFVAEQRTKEIGIRKVLGASVSRLWQMLSQDFVLLVIVSCFLAVPIAYYFVSDWLGNYQYRIEIQWWVFLLSCIAAILITLFTVSFQAIRAALMSPVDSLKSE